MLALALIVSAPSRANPALPMPAGVALAGSALPAADPDVGSAKEIGVKVGFLYNFTKLVAWPSSAFADAKAPFVVGVLGRNRDGSHTFEGVLESALAGTSVGERPIVVRRYETAKQARGAHVLYVGTSMQPQLPAVLDAFAGAPTLLVSSVHEFAQWGGMIGFRVEAGRLKFAINERVGRQGKLVFSSKLLSLADIVTTRPREPRD